jgi:hypothetical protein
LDEYQRDALQRNVYIVGCLDGRGLVAMRKPYSVPGFAVSVKAFMSTKIGS